MVYIRHRNTFDTESKNPVNDISNNGNTRACLLVRVCVCVCVCVYVVLGCVWVILNHRKYEKGKLFLIDSNNSQKVASFVLYEVKDLENL